MALAPDHPLLFIAADRREAEPWVARWNNLRPLKLPVHWARTGRWQGREVMAIANGVGKQRAVEAVQTGRDLAGSLAGICSIGTAGALEPSLAIADVIVASAVTDGRNNWPALDPCGSAARSGVVYSSDHIARSREEKTNLRRSGAIIVEMESAGVAGVAQDMRVPFYCVRVVSDLAGETFFTDFESFLTADGRFDVARLAMHAIAHPVKGLGELLRLQKRTSLAAETLATFLATCKF